MGATRRPCSGVFVGTYPGVKESIGSDTQGNNGYFTQPGLNRLDNEWGPVLNSSDNVSGTNTNGKDANYWGNPYKTSKADRLLLQRPGTKSSKVVLHVGDYNTGTYMGNSMRSTFMPNVIGCAFMWSKDRSDGSTSDNKNTEGRLRNVYGIYAQGGTSNNGKMITVRYGTILDGSMALNPSNYGYGDHHYAMRANNTDCSYIRANHLCLEGFIFDIDLNHNLAHSQNPTGGLWHLRPILSLSGSQDQSLTKVQQAVFNDTNRLIQLYPFETTTWSEANPYYFYQRKALKLNTANP